MEDFEHDGAYRPHGTNKIFTRFCSRTTKKENLCGFRRSRDSNRIFSPLYMLRVKGDIEIVVG
jgi:hypothetical protein